MQSKPETTKKLSLKELLAYNRGLEDAAKIVETKMWSKRRSVADLIRQEKYIP